MIVLGYTSLGVDGFKREKPATPVGAQFWRAVDVLIRGDVPPPAVRNTGRHPVWGLRTVDVDGEQHWCFSVQGRGGPFGPGGMCRFGFVPVAEVSAADAWIQGRFQVAGAETRPEPPSPDLIAGLLGALARGAPAIPIEAGPATAAAVIEHILHVVPPAVVARATWFTCLLQTSGMRGRLVAGHTPPEFDAAIPDVRRQLDDLVERAVAGAAPRPIDPDVLRALVAAATERKAPPDRATTLADLLGDPDPDPEPGFGPGPAAVPVATAPTDDRRAAPIRTPGAAPAGWRTSAGGADTPDTWPLAPAEPPRGPVSPGAMRTWWDRNRADPGERPRWLPVALVAIVLVLVVAATVLIRQIGSGNPPTGSGTASSPGRGPKLTLLLHADASAVTRAQPRPNAAANAKLTRSWEMQIKTGYDTIRSSGATVESIVVITYGPDAVLLDRVRFEADIAKVCDCAVSVGRTDTAIDGFPPDSAEVQFFLRTSG